MSAQESDEEELPLPPEGKSDVDADSDDEDSYADTDVKPPVYRKKLMAAQLLDGARSAIKDDQDFGITAEERLAETKLAIADINAAIAGIDEWHKERLLQQQQKGVYDEEDDDSQNQEAGPESEAEISFVDNDTIQHEMKRYTPSEKQILQLQSLEELTRSPFNYLPLNCLEKYSALFAKVKQAHGDGSANICTNNSTPENCLLPRVQYNNLNGEEESTTTTTTTTSTLLSTVFVGMNIKDTMSKRRVEGLFHEYLLENEMYRIQQESRQEGFLESMAQERQVMAAEADMSHGVDSLRNKLMEFSNDVDFLLDGPPLATTTISATFIPTTGRSSTSSTSSSSRATSSAMNMLAVPKEPIARSGASGAAKADMQHSSSISSSSRSTSKHTV